MLAKHNSSFAEVVKVLQEYQENIGDVPATDADGQVKELDGGASAADIDAANKRQIVGHLIAYLRGC